MHFLVHWRIWQKSKKCRRSTRKAILFSIWHEFFETCNIFLVIHGHQAFLSDIVKIFLWPLMNHLIEKLPVVFFDKILFDIPEDMKTVQKMMTIELSFCSHNLKSSHKSRVLVRSYYVRKMTHDVRKCLQYLHISLFCLLVADYKAKRNQLFWWAYSCKNTNSPSSAIIISFLDDIVGEVKTHPMTKLLKVVFH